jgi:hypothetical protein
MPKTGFVFLVLTFTAIYGQAGLPPSFRSVFIWSVWLKLQLEPHLLLHDGPCVAADQSWVYGVNVYIFIQYDKIIGHFSAGHKAHAT